MPRITTILILFFLQLAFRQGASAAIVNLGDGGGVNAHPHNLSTNNNSSNPGVIRSTTEDQICIFCHTPHGGSAKGPLWNRPDPTVPAGGTFDLSARPALNIADPLIVPISLYDNSDPESYPNGATRLCLSCHDGVTAIGTFLVGNATMTDNYMSVAGTIDLSSTHPVSFVYNNATKKPAMSIPIAGDAAKLDGADRMQCTTCHDPHTHTNDGTYTLPMWRYYGSGGTDENADYSAMCTSCHVGTPGVPDIHNM